MKHTRSKKNGMKRHMRMLAILLVPVVALILGAAAPELWAGGHDDDDDEIPFDEAQLFFELNNTDGDLGIHALIDGEAWKRLTIEDTKERARRDGFVETMLGRRRYLPDIGADNDRIRSFQERVAVNTPIQGTAADLIKLAMIRIAGDLRRLRSDAMLLLQVHDELVLEVAEGEVSTVSELVRRDMETALELDVPLVVDLHTGKNWAEAHG